MVGTDCSQAKACVVHARERRIQTPAKNRVRTVTGVLRVWENTHDPLDRISLSFYDLGLTVK